MSEPSLHELERDVEAARARLAADLTTLRSPATTAEFTETLKSEALEAKDSLVEQAKSSVQSTIAEFVEDLKAKAAANPTAALAIGTGIAWRLLQRPPIATALVGAGLISLLRTNARRGIYAPEGYLAAAKDRLKEQASDAATSLKDQAVAAGEVVKEKASELASAASETVKDKATELAGTAQERVQQWRGQAEAAARHTAADLQEQARSVKDRASGMADRASDMAGRASDTMGEFVSDQETRDKLLLGAAGVAVVAALSIAFQRRLSGEPAE